MHRDLRDSGGGNNIVLLRLAMPLKITPPSIPQPDTPIFPYDRFQILSWSSTDFDAITDVRIRHYTVQLQRNGGCAYELELGENPDLLCMRKERLGGTCRENIGFKPPTGGTARPLVRLDHQGYPLSHGESEFDQVFGLEVSTSDPCNNFQQEIFISFVDISDWIYDIIDHMESPLGSVGSPFLEEEETMECMFCGLPPPSNEPSPNPTEDPPNTNCSEVLMDGFVEQAIMDDADADVRVFFDCGGSVGQSPSANGTLLHLAAAFDSVNSARVLLGHVSVAAVDDSGRTALHTSAEHNSSLVAEVLLERGADVNHVDNTGRTPLHVAAINNSLATANVLLEWGADVSAQADRFMTPLLFAANFGHADFIRILNAAEADVDARDVDRNTPLHLACYHGHVEAVEVLLELDAFCRSRNVYGWEPIDSVCHSNNCPLTIITQIEELLEEFKCG